MKKKVPKYLMLPIITILFCFFACSKDNKTLSSRFFAMNTAVSIKIYNIEQYEKRTIDSALASIRKVFLFYDSLYSPEKGIFSKEFHENRYIPLSQDQVELFSEIKKAQLLTDGYFDISLGKVIDLWGFGKYEVKNIPADSILEKQLDSCGIDNFYIVGDTLITKYKNMNFNLSGVAKGWSVDIASSVLEEYKINNFLIEAGGDLVVKKENYAQIGIRDPRNLDYLLDTLKVRNVAIATSGDYENFFLENQKRYCHILSPKTGRSSDDLASVTIVSNRVFLADLYATALFAMGFNKAYKFATSNHISAILVSKKHDKKDVIEYVNMEEYLNLMRN